MDEEEETQKLLNNDAPSKVSTPPRLLTIEPVILLYTMAIAPMDLLVEQYIYRYISTQHNFTGVENGETGNLSQCTANSTDQHHILQEKVQSETSYFTLYLSIANFVPMLFTTLWFGSYSDRVSRKRPLLFPLIAGVTYSVLAIIIVFFTLDIRYLFIGFILDGMSGALATTQMVCFAYTADISSTDKRTLRFVILEFLISLGTAVTSVSMSYIMKFVSLYLCFIILVILHIVNLLYVCLFLPDSVQGGEKSKIFTLDHFRHYIHLFVKLSNGLDRKTLWLSMAIFVFGNLSTNCSPTVMMLFFQNAPLCFTVDLIAIFSAMFILIGHIGSLSITFLFKSCLQDIGLIVVGAVSLTAFNTALAFSNSLWSVYITLFIAVAMYLPVAVIQSVSSKTVNPSEQGILLSSLMMLQILTYLLGTPLFNTIYAETVGSFAGTAFLVMAGCGVVTLLLTGMLRVFLRRKSGGMIKEVYVP